MSLGLSSTTTSPFMLASSPESVNDSKCRAEEKEEESEERYVYLMSRRTLAFERIMLASRRAHSMAQGRRP